MPRNCGSRRRNALLGEISGAIGELDRLLSGLARGELDQRIERRFQGVIGEMVANANANATVDRLGDIVGRIRTSAESARVASQEDAVKRVGASARSLPTFRRPRSSRPAALIW